MPETLLSLSEVLLFGREVEDLQIREKPKLADADHQATVATAKKLDATNGHPAIDGEAIALGDKVLVFHQHGAAGLYLVNADFADWTPIPVAIGETVSVDKGKKNKGTFWIKRNDTGRQFKRYGKRAQLGKNKQLGDQLDDDARFARIYGFSYEGTYYELPNPTLFLVHGDGESATDGNNPGNLASRTSNDPSVSGVGAADFQIADDIRVWAYDKADYTIRMDVETGMIEQILLDVFFGVEAPMVAGGRVAGGRVAGGRVAGGRVAGGRVAGGRVSGGRVGGSSD